MADQSTQELTKDSKSQSSDKPLVIAQCTFCERLYPADSFCVHCRNTVNTITRGANIPEDRIAAASVSVPGRWAKHYATLTSRMMQDDSSIYALLGDRGVGKTQLAAAVLREACQQHLTCRYTKAADLFMDLRASFHPREAQENEREFFERMARYDVLVIDEAHERSESAFENNTLVRLIDRRYDKRLCTILIANQTAKAFAQSVGDSVSSRMSEPGSGVLVCDWPTFRRPGMAKPSPGRRVPRNAG